MYRGFESFRHRGQYRFRQPIDSRYTWYWTPHDIVSKCVACGRKVAFHAVVPKRYEEHSSGGMLLLDLPISGPLEGRGSCIACGKIVERISWPEDAYYRFLVQRGDVWAWNDDCLRALRAKVAGDRQMERTLCLKNGGLHWFLARVPKHVVVKRNRAFILAKIDRYLREPELRATRGQA